jgi:hypothetical protein
VQPFSKVEMSSSSENQPFCPLIKCLYNSSSYSTPLRISDICFNAYAERYGAEFEYIGKAYSIDTKLIALVEELGLEQCSGHGTFLLCQSVPEELKDYIDVRFEEGIKKACIDYDKVYADILHKQIVDCESGELSDGLLMNSLYKQYHRIKYIQEHIDEDL